MISFFELQFQKERDLELAARIGQQLLEDNQVLRSKVTTLETDNKDSIEIITQLKYELNFKSQLLEIYNADNTTESADASKVGMFQILLNFSTKLPAGLTYYMCICIFI